MVLSSSSPAVASRCIHLRHGVGGVASQNITDPRLGWTLLDLMEQGEGVHDALASVVKSAPTSSYRQLAAVDANGGSATFSGSHCLGISNQVSAENCAAAGNMLSDPDVIDAVIDAFVNSQAIDFEEQLLEAIMAGVNVGGEEGPLHSAGIRVTGPNGWALTDLRIDFDHQPVEKLWQLWQDWKPQLFDYQTRGLDPASAPAYGVPGDR